MNKLELIDTLRDECRISKKEAASIIIYFLEKFLKRLQGVIGLKFGDYVIFL